MALDLILLSVLRAAPAHGYELKRQVQRPTFARLSNNSLYPHLRRFEQLGAVTSSVEEQDGRPARRIYSITDAGRALFTDLVSALPHDLAGSDEEFLVRLSFFGEIDAPARKAILAARADVLAERIAQVQTLKDESVSMPQWRAIAMDHLLDQLTGEIDWIAGLTLNITESITTERERNVPGNR
ncbi:MAG: PadR family transcriptional regulator [Microbacteriaceae bacterium]|jgi:DNA-binding PadR family transcriptional regulator|nr:PadR family transcriptional regulator [Microbacteriaceae bacterium]